MKIKRQEKYWQWTLLLRIICQLTLYPYQNDWQIEPKTSYRFSPLDGSPADTLGLDNHPVAKFRFEADTINHLRVRFSYLSYFRPESWRWKFGDGKSWNGKRPLWHTFPQNGSYKVCLTVCNENSCDTICRWLTLGPNAIPEAEVVLSKTTLHQNPQKGHCWSLSKTTYRNMLYFIYTTSWVSGYFSSGYLMVGIAWTLQLCRLGPIFTFSNIGVLEGGGEDLV
ncbi:MAG: PKD domain-containing protein [Saprospiraceae bacterium]